MKMLLFISVLLLWSYCTEAQFTTLARSIAFEEPEKGFAKILLLKNKKTVYLHIEPTGIKVKIYGDNFKQSATTMVTSSQGKFSELNVEAVFEINSNVVLMLSEYEKNTPILYRIVIDGNTGRKISDEKIAEMEKAHLGQAFANLYGVPLPDFLVRKDPQSDNYCLIIYNTNTSSSEGRVEFVTYDKDHKEVSRVFLSDPENKFKYVNILDAVVLNDKQAFALLYVYNTKSSGGKENDLLLASFKSGESNISYINLNNDDEKKVEAGIIKYNATSKKLVVASFVKEHEKGKGNKTTMYYSLPIHIIDPITKTVKLHPGIDLREVDTKHRELFGAKNAYSGSLQNIMMNDDGGYSIILEGLLSYSGNTTDDFYGSIAVLNYSQNDQLISSALIPKKQEYNNNAFSGGGVSFGMGAKAVRLTQKPYFKPLYHRDRDWSGNKLGGGNQYKSFSFINGQTKNYILFNDIEENGKRILEGKLTNIQGLGECDAFSFEANSGNILPSRKFVFGKTNDKKDHNLAVFTVSDYDRESNIYVTLCLQIEGRDRKVKLVWLQPQ